MGVTCRYVRIPASDVNRLWADPEAVVFAQSGTGFHNDPSMEHWININKSWAGLGYLLDKSAGFETDLVLGGQPVAVTIDGPICYLEPDGVKQMSTLLKGTPFDRLRNYYDPADMRASDVYPEEVWREDPDESVFPWLRSQYQRLTTFYAVAADADDGVASVLT
jgi:Domain of unknown function (DUF1877)